MLFSSKSNNPKQLISTHIPMVFSNEHAKLYMIFHWFPMFFFSPIPMNSPSDSYFPHINP